MGNKVQTVVNCAVAAILASAAFGIGLKFQPDSQAGRNLYNPHGKSNWTQSASNDVALASLHTSSKRVADGDGLGRPLDDLSGDDTQSDSPAATFQQVFLLVKRKFVDPMPKDAVLGHDAVRAMLTSLQDPESRFLEPAELVDERQKARGIYHGIGVVTSIRKLVHAKGATRDLPGYTDFQLTVVSALPGSPAEKAGLKAGDVITEINHKWVASYDPVAAEAPALKAAQRDPVTVKKIVATITAKMDTSLSVPQAESSLDGFDYKMTPGAVYGLEAEPVLEGPMTTPLVLTIVRPGETKAVVVSVERNLFTISPMANRVLQSGIGYIKVAQFTDGSEAEIGKALDGFGTDLKGLVLDLRNAPGGGLDASSAIASRMTSSATLGYLRIKGKKDTVISVKRASALTCPIVVLVNRGTGSTAELLAATLQEHGAKLVGTPTFGDASDVQVIPLRDGSAVTMTVGELLRGNHQEFAGIGIKPDVTIQDVAGSDRPLAAGLGLLVNHVASNPPARG